MSKNIWPFIAGIMIGLCIGVLIGRYLEKQNNPINKIENLLK